MSDEVGKARDTVAAIDEIFVRYADEWVCIQECWWKISQNPVFVWKALKLLLHPTRSANILPEWVTSYLRRSADNLNEIFHRDPGEAAPLLGQAIGLLSPSRSIIADADRTLEAPLFIAEYNRLLKQAPGSQRSAWAHSEMRRMFSLQSDEVVRQRLLEARKTMQAFVIARGQIPEAHIVDQTCEQLCELQALISEVFKEAEIPIPSSEEVRAGIGSPMSRRAAVQAFQNEANMRAKAKNEEE